MCPDIRGNFVNSAEITAVIDAQLDIVDPFGQKVIYKEGYCYIGTCVGRMVAREESDIWVYWDKRCEIHNESERVHPVPIEQLREI